MKSNNTHDGHRIRMREKLESGNLADLPEHEQLEILLFSVIPRGNTNEIAHELLKKFGSIYGVLSADISSLLEVDGIGARVADFLHNLPAVLGVVMRSKISYETDNKFLLNDINTLKDYLFSLFSDTVSERAYILFLNKRFRLIKFEKISDGSLEQVYIDISKAVRRAILNNAAYVVLTHNHPSGSVMPSDADISSTRELDEALNTVGIGLLDHIIIGGDSYYSFRESRHY